MNNLKKMDNFVEKNTHLRLNQREIENINRPITSTEIETVKKDLKNKSQGPDDFLGKFYQMVRQELTPILLNFNLFQKIVEGVKLTNSFYKAIITLIPKPEKDTRKKKKERKIQADINDVKILKKVPANKILQHIKRSYTMIIWGLSHGCKDSLIHAINSYDIPYQQIEISKPYDHLNRYREIFQKNSTPFRIKTLQKVGIEGTFLNVIKAIYDKPTAKIILNGEKLKPFLLRSGTRPGYQLSPLLFNIVLEVLAMAVREEKEFILERKKLSLFADDMILYIENLKNSTKKLPELIKEFSKVAGYKINTQKIHGIPIH